MNSPDIINGAFEACGAWFMGQNCRAVIKDRGYRGLYIPAQVFFTSWGLWNLFFYPHLGQTFSFIGGACLVAMNALYMVLIIRYGKAEKRLG